MVEYIFWEERVPLKSGKPGKRWRTAMAPYTPIHYCDMCGKFGPPKKVRYRDDVFGWNRDGPKDFTTKSKHMLCVGCWNKVRPLVNREIEARKLSTFINKLQRDICNEKKRRNQDHGRP